jgi:hypothetical protein
MKERNQVMIKQKKNVQKKVMIKQNWKSQREEALDKQNM